MPRVVACMPAWNAQAFIAETLHSLAAQTYPNLQILISDDASSDGTEKICREFARAHARVKYIRQQRRLGWVGNANALLKLAEGEYFFFAFHDDPVQPTYVERLVEALERRPTAVLAFSDVEAQGMLRVYDVLDHVHDPIERARRILRREGLWWWVPNRGLFRAEAARQLGGMRRHLAGEFAADWPWMLRLALLGEFVRVPETLVRKTWLPSGLTRVWRHSLWQRFGVRLACHRVIVEAGLPLRLAMSLHGDLLIPPLKEYWWTLHRTAARFRQR